MTQKTQVVLLGTGSAIPSARRLATSHLFLSGNEKVLVDAGPGAGYRLAQAGYLPKDVSRIFLTHLHADHCLELPALALAAFLGGRADPLPVVGPPGTRAHVDLVFGTLFRYMSKLVANRGRTLAISVDEVDEGGRVEAAEFVARSTRVIHGPDPTLAYRFDTPSGSVVFSGDTAPCDALVTLSGGADLLIHECPFPDSQGPHPAHTIPSQLGPVAKRAGVRSLAMNHFFPQCEDQRDAMIASVSTVFDGDIIFGEDRQTLVAQR